MSAEEDVPEYAQYLPDARDLRDQVIDQRVLGMPANVYELWHTLGVDPRDPLALLKASVRLHNQVMELTGRLKTLEERP